MKPPVPLKGRLSQRVSFFDSKNSLKVSVILCYQQKYFYSPSVASHTCAEIILFGDD